MPSMFRSLSLVLLFACMQLVTNGQQKEYLLQGNIINAFGEAVKNANVKISGTSKAVQSDSTGIFKLLLQQGAYKIEITSVGYKSKQLIINLQSDTIVTFSMLEKNFTQLQEVIVEDKTSLYKKWLPPKWQ